MKLKDESQAFEEQEDALAQVSDPTIIASLLEVYRSDSAQTPDGEGWVFLPAEWYAVIAEHDFPIQDE